MRSRLLTNVLTVAIFLALVMLALRLAAYRLPGNQQGYEPPQPIAFSHRLHAGEMQIDCQYCHFAAERSRHAGIPAASVCMNCHRFVSAPLGAVRAEDERAKQEGRQARHVVAPEIAKLYLALGLGESGQPGAASAGQPIAWIKVHNLPEFVYFDHASHVLAGVDCQRCHGPVERMERVRQVESLGMGWCVNCHRAANRDGVKGRRVNATTDCVGCHF